MINEYFGINALSLVHGGVTNEKRQLRRLKRLRKRSNLIYHNHPKQREILHILKKPLDEKRNEKELIKLEPLLNQLNFFTKTRPMDKDELLEVCKNLQYEFREAGETVFK